MRFVHYCDHLMHHHGRIGQAVLGCFVVLGALWLDRLVALARASGPGVELRMALERSLAAGDLDEALGMAAATRGAFARVALRVLRDGLRDAEHMEAAAEEALAVELPPLERRVAAFGFLASLATLLGLLASTSLISGYDGPNVDADVRATILARSFSESMICVAAGLLAAVVAFVARWLVRALIDRREAIVRAETRALLNTLIASRARLRLLDQRPILEPRGYRRVDVRV